MTIEHLSAASIAALATDEGQALSLMLDEAGGDVLDRSRGLRSYAFSAAANGVERAVVETVVRAGYSKYVAPLIRKYNPPGPDGLYIEAGEWLVVYLCLMAYDSIRKD